MHIYIYVHTKRRERFNIIIIFYKTIYMHFFVKKILDCKKNNNHLC